jgi:hypothetical protein
VQLVPNGPDIPPAVIESLEADRLVLFCGAGISMGAGLPLFAGLVDRVFRDVHEPPDDLEQKAIDDRQFDRALHLLEQRLQVPQSMRDSVARALTTSNDHSSAIHGALLRLGMRPGHRLLPRLVTTNFDLLFQSTARRADIAITVHAAPSFPVPKPHKWDSIVYLHGRLSQTGDHRNLVLTSADFGTAYLTEGWAARFLRDLFASYTVLFVGYSADDPVMRYVLDALASERSLDSSLRRTFSFVDITSSSAAGTIRAWRAKGVEPIPYDNSNNHELLRATLEKWAELWWGGMGSRRAVALSYGRQEPATLPPEEKSMFLWAMGHSSGIEAFCSLECEAPFAWLKVFEGFELAFGDEVRARPLLTSPDVQLNRAGRKIAAWAAGHIKSSELLSFVLSRGGGLHHEFQRLLKYRIRDCGLSGGALELWRLLCLPFDRCDDFPDLPIDSDRDSRIQLLRLVEPIIRWDPWGERIRELLTDGRLAEHASDIAGIEIQLRAGPQCERLVGRFALWSPEAKASLALALTGRLAEILELFRAAGSADEHRDPSVGQRPSISPSEQNFGHRQWTCLIDLVRESAMALDAIDPAAARALVCVWTRAKYPVFRRLALDAVAHGTSWTTAERLDLLLGNE